MGAKISCSSSIAESVIHIIEPVATQTLLYIVGRLGYADRFKGNIDIISDSRLTNKTKNESGNAKIRVDRVRAKLNPNVNPNAIKWEGSGTTVDLGNGNVIVQNTGGNHAIQRPWGRGTHDAFQKYAVFADDEYDIHLYEKTVGSAFTMEVTMDFNDQITGDEALSRIYQCFQNGEMINTIDVQYDYPMPERLDKIIAYLYSLRGRKTTTETCISWLKEGSKNAITLLTNRNRPEHQEVVINKNNFQAIYLIECTQEFPAPADPAGCSITFNVTVQYARVNRLVIEYPVIVNNQYVDQKYIPVDTKFRVAGETLDPVMWSNPGYTRYWRMCQKNDDFHPFRYPWWDPWTQPTNSLASLAGYKEVLSVAVTLDNLTDPQGKTSFDLAGDLESALECKLEPTLEYCIRRYKNKVLKSGYYAWVAVYADDIPLDPTHVDLSDGHTVIFDSRDPKPVYRVVVAINLAKKHEMSAFLSCSGGAADPELTYYIENPKRQVTNQPRMAQLKVRAWENLDSLICQYGSVYTDYDQDTLVCTPCADTVAVEDKLYFVLINGKYVPVEVKTGESLAAIIAQYGQIYSMVDRVEGVTYVGPYGPSRMSVISSRIIVHKPSWK